MEFKKESDVKKIFSVYLFIHRIGYQSFIFQQTSTKLLLHKHVLSVCAFSNGGRIIGVMCFKVGHK